MANNTKSWRLKEFVSKHIWESYSVILLFFLTLLYFILYNFYSPHINTVNALNILSVLAQAQAGIIAIVVSLILVAVQISAQTYSPKVMDIFKDFKDFWVLIALFGISIFVDIFVIYLAPHDEPYNNFDIITNLAIIIALVAFTSLFPFIARIIDLLKSKNIIEKISNKIIREEFLKTVSEKYAANKDQYSRMLLVNDEDQIVPLIDVTKRAIRLDDVTTARDGIEKLERILCDILNYDGNKDGIIIHFCEHFTRIAELAFIQEDGDTIIEIVRSLGIFGNKTIESEPTNKSIREISRTIEYIAIRAIMKRWGLATEASLESLADMYITYVNKEMILKGDGLSNVKIYPHLIRISIENIVKATPQNEPEFVQQYIASPIKNKSIAAIEKIGKFDGDFYSPISMIDLGLVSIIVTLGKVRMIDKSHSLTDPIVSYLLEIGTETAKIEANNKKIWNTYSNIFKNQIISLFEFALDLLIKNKNEIFIMNIVNTVGRFGQETSMRYTSHILFRPPPAIVQELDAVARENISVEYNFILSCLNEFGNKTKNITDKELREKILNKIGKFVIIICAECEEENFQAIAEKKIHILNNLGLKEVKLI